jgi:phage anti-repressor protein
MELIKIQENDKGQKVVSAKDLYLFLGYDKSQWSRWFKKNIIENQFAFENEDWVGFDTMSNGNIKTDFALTLDFAKRISMMARTEKGEKVRTYFINCEKQLQAPQLPTTYLEALTKLVETETEKQNLQIELDEHKAWYSVKRVCLLGHFKSSEAKNLWRALKKYSIEHNYQIQSIFDANYGEVKTYHKDVWFGVYGVNL